MSIHLHHTRQCAAWCLTAAALLPFALCFAATGVGESVELAEVSGQLKMGGQPLEDVCLCLDRGEEHCAFGWLQEDGKFLLSNMRWFDGGAEPGQYRVHMYTHEGGPPFPAMYRDTKTSGLVLDVGSGWNDFRIDLP